MPAKFNLSKDGNGKFVFSLLAPNGAVVATSQPYASKAAALGGVASVRKNAPAAPIDDTTLVRKAAAAKAPKPVTARRPAKAVGTVAAKPAAKRASTRPATKTSPAKAAVAKSVSARKSAEKAPATAAAATVTKATTAKAATKRVVRKRATPKPAAG